MHVKIAKVDAEAQNFKQSNLMANDYAQQIMCEDVEVRLRLPKKYSDETSGLGVHRYSFRTLCQRSLKIQHASEEDYAQKAESFAEIQGNKPRSDKLVAVNKEDRQAGYKNNRNLPLRYCCVFNVTRSSPPSSSRHRIARYSTDRTKPYATAISITDLVAAFKSGLFHLNQTTSTNSRLFCRVCINDNHRTSKCDQGKKNPSYIGTINTNFDN